VKDARDWLSQTVKDAKAKDVKEAYYHSIKALAAINHARDDFPK
jgi:hypothetical protein